MSSALPSNAHSTALRQQLANSGSLLGALDAVTNWRAFVLLSATLIAAVMTTAVFGALTVFLATKSSGIGAFSGFISALIVAAVVLVGVNAVGIMLSDEVWDRVQRGMMDALLASVFTSHRLVAIVLIEAVLFLVFLIALIVVLFACKIPGIGPVFYAAVFPVGAIATGTVIFALAYIAIPLAAPAVWNGESVTRALVMLKEVARTRMLHVVVMMVLLGVLTGFVVGIVSLILLSGTSVVASLSAIVVGVSSGGMTGMLSMLAGGGSGSGYAYALGFGASILLLIGASPGMLIGIKGASIIYREASATLSLDDAEADINRRMDDLKRRAEEAKQRATATQPQTTPTPAPITSVCPNCTAPIGPDEMFCGNCGHKLK